MIVELCVCMTRITAVVCSIYVSWPEAVLPWDDGVYVVLQNEERKTRTSVFVMVVTEVLDDWDDAKTIGKLLPLSLPAPMPGWSSQGLQACLKASQGHKADLLQSDASICISVKYYSIDLHAWQGQIVDIHLLRYIWLGKYTVYLKGLSWLINTGWVFLQMI